MKMNASIFSNLLFMFIIIITANDLLPFVNSQSTESCSSSLNLKDHIPFDTTSLNCLSVWDAQGFILRYEHSETNKWSFMVSAPQRNGYIGMAFSRDGKMIGSSAVIGWIESNGSGKVKQYFLGGKSPQLVTVDQGNLQLLPNSTVIISQSSRLYMAFQLLTSESQRPLSSILYSIGPDGILPTSPAYSLFEHSEKVFTSINYISGTSTTLGTQYSRLRKTHGAMNMLGWGILIIIGVIIARYFKSWDPTWFYVHISIQCVGFIFGLIGIICGLVLDNHLNANVGRHKAIGIFVLVLGCLQVMALLARPKKESKARVYWSWYHYVVGRILIIMAIANIFYGINLGEKEKGWKVGYGIIVALLFLVSLILEVRFWIRK